MRNKTCESLGFKFDVEVPSPQLEPLSEFDRLAGRPGAESEEANNNVLYRSTYPDFRENIIVLLEQETGAPRNRSETKNKDGSVSVRITENDGTYVSRVVTAAGGTYPADSMAKFGHLVAKAVAGFTIGEGDAAVTYDAVRFDPSVKERKPPQPKTIPAIYLKNADATLAGDPGVLAKITGNLKAALGRDVVITGDNAVDRETLARAIKEYKDKQDVLGALSK